MDRALSLILPLLVAYVLDRLIGDPSFLPHPIRLFGYGIRVAEHRLNRGKARKIKGLCCVLLLLSSTYAAFFWLIASVSPYPLAVQGVEALCIYYALAQGSLIRSGKKVFSALKGQDLSRARQQLTHLVGRDTSALSKQDIRKATLESWAENLSDGIVAPLLFYALGGVPLMMTYKMLNTMDSMMGYKNKRYQEFGYFAAKLDDVANFFPARLTAVLMILLSRRWQAFRTMCKYAPRHLSPNAGYPEAALAGILSCQLGGPAVYGKKVIARATLGGRPRPLRDEDARLSQRLIEYVSACTLAMTMGLSMWLRA